MSHNEDSFGDITGTNDNLPQVAVRYPMYVRDGDSILPYGRDPILWGPQDPLDLIGRKFTYLYISILPLIL
jgi:hypothetical protein